MKVFLLLLAFAALFIASVQSHTPQRILAGEAIYIPKTDTTMKISIDAPIPNSGLKMQAPSNQPGEPTEFDSLRLRATSEPDAINLNDFSSFIEKRLTKGFSRALNKEPEKNVKTQSNAQAETKIDAAGNAIDANDRKEELCNRNFIEALGIVDIQNDKPQKVVKSQHEYCPKNKESCCTSDQLKKIQRRFHDAHKKLDWKIDLIEDIFNLFRGKMPISKIFRLLKTLNDDKSKCQETLNRDTDEFITPAFIFSQLDEMSSLLTLMPIFRKQQIWFYGNLICTACNAHETRHFKITPDRSSIALDMRSCTDMMNTRTVEARVMRLFYDFLVPLAKFIDCSEDKNEFEIESELFNEEIVTRFEANIENCANNFSPGNKDCLEMCKKPLHYYNFPADIFQVAHKVLKVLYKAFTNMDIADFYALSKKEILEDEFSVPYSFFSEETTAFKNYQIAKISWTLSNDGANIYFNYISKNFVDNNWSGLAGVWAVMILICLMIIG